MLIHFTYFFRSLFDWRRLAVVQFVWKILSSNIFITLRMCMIYIHTCNNKHLIDKEKSHFTFFDWIIAFGRYWYWKIVCDKVYLYWKKEIYLVRNERFVYIQLLHDKIYGIQFNDTKKKALFFQNNTDINLIYVTMENVKSSGFVVIWDVCGDQFHKISFNWCERSGYKTVA